MTDMNIMVSSVGKRVELIELLRKTMDNMRIKGNIIALDTDSTAPALYFADRHYLVSRCDSERFINEITDIARKENVSLMIPTIDTELPYLAVNRELIESNSSMQVMISDIDIIDIFFDKRNTASFFADKGIPVPGMYESMDDAVLPVIVKPVRGSAARGIRIIEHNEQKKDIPAGDDVIIQEMIHGREITIDAFCDFKGNLVSVGMRERLRVRDGEVQIGKTVFIEKIYRYIEKLIAHGGFRGGVTFQAFIADGNVYFIECNPRFGGGLPLTIMAGNNFLSYLLQIIQNGEVKTETVRQSETEVIFSRYDQSLRIPND